MLGLSLELTYTLLNNSKLNQLTAKADKSSKAKGKQILPTRFTTG